MNHKKKITAVAAAAAVVVLALTGCSTAAAPAASSGPVKLTLTTWGEFGYEKLITKYEAENPGVTIVSRKAASGDAARDATNTYLASGSGLGDVIAVESGWLAQMMQYPDKFQPVNKSLDGRWLSWKSGAATDKSGVLRMYGVDAAPAGICYNKELFAKAGLPTDRDSVAKLLTGSWKNYLTVGKQFTEKTGVPWFASISEFAGGEVNQLQYSFEDKNNKVIAPTNPAVKKAYDDGVANISLSAKMPVFGTDWTKGLGQSSFGTMICPSWMLGVIKGSAKSATYWDVADVFPGGGLNEGGSYLAVPIQSKTPAAAEKFAAWLTAPEQQLAAFEAVGAFPSQVKALSSSQLAKTSDVYFQDAPTGNIFSGRAKAIKVQPYKGPKAAQISSFFNDALNRVEAGSLSADASWAKFESDVKSIQ